MAWHRKAALELIGMIKDFSVGCTFAEFFS